MNEPQLIAPGLWSATLPAHGTRFFRFQSLAWCWIIDPENPLFSTGEAHDGE